MLRALARRACTLRSLHSNIRRSQHTGPHKEYFQDPSQYPKGADGQARAPGQSPFPRQHSILIRSARSVLWATTFSILGTAAGVVAVTWDYLQPPFNLGSEEELEMLDEIDELLSTHPLVDALAQDDNWKEQQMYMADREWAKNENFHFLSRNTLNGSNGISMAFFFNKLENQALLLFFPGYGMEGWPDIVHGGIISTLIMEAMEQTANLYVGSVTGKHRVALQQINIDFRAPLHPGNIYAVFVTVQQEALNEKDAIMDSLRWTVVPRAKDGAVRAIHAIVMETDDLAWQIKDGVAVVHATATGRLKEGIPLDDTSQIASVEPKVNNDGPGPS